MFITNLSQQVDVPQSLAQGSLSAWRSVELQKEEPLYMVRFKHSEELLNRMFTVDRTLLVIEISDLQAIFEFESSGKISIDEVFVLTPTSWNGSGGWQAERLGAIREHKDEKNNLQIKIIETMAGEVFCAPENQNNLTVSAMKSKVVIQAPVDRRPHY